MLTAEQRRARARLASKTAEAGRRPHDLAVLAEVNEARRDYRAISAEEYVRRLVYEAPVLSASQRDRLALLLRPTATESPPGVIAHPVQPGGNTGAGTEDLIRGVPGE